MRRSGRGARGVNSAEEIRRGVRLENSGRVTRTRSQEKTGALLGEEGGRG